MTSWSGLDEFASIKIFRSSDGKRIRNIRATGCFNGEAARIGPNGPASNPFPWGCPWNPYTLGSVMGVAQDYSSSLLPEWGTPLRLKPGIYEMVAGIAPEWRSKLGISDTDGAVTTKLVVKKARNRFRSTDTLSAGRRGTDNLDPVAEEPTEQLRRGPRRRARTRPARPARLRRQHQREGHRDALRRDGLERRRRPDGHRGLPRRPLGRRDDRLPVLLRRATASRPDSTRSASSTSTRATTTTGTSRTSPGTACWRPTRRTRTSRAMRSCGRPSSPSAWSPPTPWTSPSPTPTCGRSSPTSAASAAARVRCRCARCWPTATATPTTSTAPARRSASVTSRTAPTSSPSRPTPTTRTAATCRSST